MTKKGYSNTHREKLLIYERNYKTRNKEKIALQNKKWREQHQEHLKQYRKENGRLYRLTHKKENLEYQSNYYPANRDRAKEQRENRKKRLGCDKINQEKKKYYIKHKSHILYYNRLYKKVYPEIVNSHNLANRLIKGRKPCQMCGNLNGEKHHPDYSKPLDIIWLCHPCHIKLHIKEGKTDEK